MLQRRWSYRFGIAVAAALFSSAAYAVPPGVPALETLLHDSGMGKITKIFNGPDGLTGVILEKGMKHTVAYLTPNGHYVLFGMLLNLQNHKDVTLAEGEKYIKKYHIITGMKAAEATALAYKLHAITYGNAKANNQIILVFNTNNPLSRFAVAKMMEQAHEKLVGKMASQMCYRFLPTGPSAGWMLSGNLAQRQTRLYDFVKQKFPGSPTTKGTNRGNYNTSTLHDFPVAPPFAILDLPAIPMDTLFPIRHKSAAALDHP